MSTRATRLLLLLIVFGLPVAIFAVKPRDGRGAGPDGRWAGRSLPAVLATETILIVGFLFARSHRAASGRADESWRARPGLPSDPARPGRVGFDLLYPPASATTDVGRAELARVAGLRDLG